MSASAAHAALPLPVSVMTEGEAAPVVLAAGGTGGHLFPAQALARALLRRGVPVVLMTDARFVGSTGGQAGASNVTDPATPAPPPGFEGVTIHTIRASSPGGGSGGSWWRRVRVSWSLLVGVRQAKRLLQELRPRAVVGFGGYPSFPTMWAATRLGLPTVVHEQNALAGRVNRLLARRVRAIATSFESTQGFRALKPSVRQVHIGNPVRPAIAALRAVPYHAPEPEGAFRVLITGGSQGASIFAQVVPDALALLPPPLRARLRVDQQCRAADLDTVRTRYQSLGVAADVAAFFHDIPARLAAAHLVIGRAGASTIAELWTAGRPGLLVPYPHAADDHQTINAQAAEQAGFAWHIPQDAFTPEALAARLEALMLLPATLTTAAARAHTNAGTSPANTDPCGGADAAERLAEVVLGV